MVMASDFTDGFVEERYSTDFETNLQNEFLQSKEDADDSRSKSMDHLNRRNFNNPTQFEREEFNETDLYNYSDEGSPLYSKRDEVPLGASASDLVIHSPDVPPIGERETPIGKGMSTESIHSYKEKWQTLAQSAKYQELSTESHAKDQTLEESQQDVSMQHGEKMKHGKKKNKQKEMKEGEQLLPQQQQEQQQQQQQQLQQRQRQQQQQQQQQQLQQQLQPKNVKQNHKRAEQHQESRKFSQSAQLVRQQIEVANKLRALSAQGEYENLRDQNTSRDDSYSAASQTNREVYV
jgi:chemotaxis protein histidine kinase CheA